MKDHEAIEGISAASRVWELLREHPEARQVLARRGMMCPSCKGMENETLKHAACNHGVPLPALLDELKAAIKSGP